MKNIWFSLLRKVSPEDLKLRAPLHSGISRYIKNMWSNPALAGEEWCFMDYTENGGEGGKIALSHWTNRELRQKSEFIFLSGKNKCRKTWFSLTNLKFNNHSHQGPESSTDKMLARAAWPLPHRISVSEAMRQLSYWKGNATGFSQELLLLSFSIPSVASPLKDPCSPLTQCMWCHHLGEMCSCKAHIKYSVLLPNR